MGERTEKEKKINDDKVHIKLLIQKSGRNFSDEQIKEIQEFLDVRGDITKLKNFGEMERTAEHYLND